MSTQDEYVAVMVRKRHLPRVYGLIAELENADIGTTLVREIPVHAERGTEGGDDRTQDDPRARLTPEMVARIYNESPPAMKEILKYLAARPGEEISTRDLANALTQKEVKPNTVAGTLGAFGRRMKNRYGLGGVFPFTSRWDHAAGMQFHSMTPEMAQIIDQL